MAIETWCLMGTSAITALVICRLLATGRESVLLSVEQAKEAEEFHRKQREAVVAEIERASSDVEPL